MKNNKRPQTNEEFAEKYLEICNFLGEVIWWCQPADNPIYNIDKNGERIPRDLYEIQNGFYKAYKLYKELANNEK